MYPVDPVNPVKNILDIKLNSSAWARPTLQMRQAAVDVFSIADG